MQKLRILQQTNGAGVEESERRKLDDLVSHGNMSQHRIAPIDPENEHLKSCLPVASSTDLTKDEFRLFTRRRYDVVFYLLQSDLFVLGSCRCDGRVKLIWNH